MDACGDGSQTHARNLALIAFLYRGGPRVSEALALYPKDLDPATGAVRVLWGKGGRARTIGLDPGAFRLVGEWMRQRAALGLDARYPLFCTARGGAVSSSYIRRLFNRLGEQAGIAKRVHRRWASSDRVRSRDYGGLHGAWPFADQGAEPRRSPAPANGFGHRSHPPIIEHFDRTQFDEVFGRRLAHSTA